MKRNSKFVLFAIGASLFGSASASCSSSDSESTADPIGIRTASRVAAVNTDFTQAAEISVNSVVSIKSYATVQRPQRSEMIDPFEFFFGPGYNNRGNNNQQQQRKQKSDDDSNLQPLGLGSGVIISADGYIVTNNHVIKGAEKVEITLNDNSKYNARVIGSDANFDLALLKIDAKNLNPITFGDSDKLKVGEWVLAVGNPFGFTSTVTAGIVSAKARGLNVSEGRDLSVESFIQTDAAVNPGNSGGALVNTNGELVGINTLIYSQTGSYAGYSFAIPSSIVKKVVTDLKQYGTVQRAVLGVLYTELDSDNAKKKGITATNDGLYVEEVQDRSSAKEAGIKVGDVIVKINGENVRNSGQLKEQMGRLRPGDKAEVSYYRDNKLCKTTVTFKNDQGTTSVTKASDMISLGCAFKELSAAKKSEFGISSGVEVAGMKDGKFRRAGIKDGFIITDINNIEVNSRDDVETIYDSIMKDKKSDKVMFITGFYPTGKKVYYAVDIAD